MTLNKYRAIISLLAIILITCVACGGRGDATEADAHSASDATAIAARLTIVAATDESISANTVPNAIDSEEASVQLAEPVSAPKNTAPTQRLSVSIARSTLPSVPPPTLLPPTLLPPTATYTAIPLTLAEPTNTPILLVSEPVAQPPLVQPTTPSLIQTPLIQTPLIQTPLIQTPQTEPVTLPGSGSSPGNNSVARNPLVSFAGRWSTNVGVVDLDQNGKQVTGTYQLYGDTVRYTLTGTVSGRTLSGTYTGFDGGTFKFTLDPGEDSFDGNWFYRGAGAANHWCGVRRGPLKPWCGFSGPWESIGDYVADTPPVTEIIQTGDRIQGTFVNGVYAETGILQGQVGREGTGSQLVATGRWSIAGFSGDFRWALQDQKSDQSIGYSVTSDGVLHQWCNWRPGLSMPDECFEPE